MTISQKLQKHVCPRVQDVKYFLKYCLWKRLNSLTMFSSIIFNNFTHIFIDNVSYMYWLKKNSLCIFYNSHTFWQCFPIYFWQCICDIYFQQFFGIHELKLCSLYTPIVNDLHEFFLYNTAHKCFLKHWSTKLTIPKETLPYPFRILSFSFKTGHSIRYAQLSADYTMSSFFIHIYL